MDGENCLQSRSSDGEKVPAPAGVDGVVVLSSVSTIVRFGLVGVVVKAVLSPFARDWVPPDVRPARLAALYTHGCRCLAQRAHVGFSLLHPTFVAAHESQLFRSFEDVT